MIKEEPEAKGGHCSGGEAAKQNVEEVKVKVPNYYNPGAINPLKFSETEKKRKMLWSRDDDNCSQVCLITISLCRSSKYQLVTNISYPYENSTFI